jgi:hypothetical protein
MVGVWYGCRGGVVDCIHKLETVEGEAWNISKGFRGILRFFSLSWHGLFSGGFFFYSSVL